MCGRYTLVDPKAIEKRFNINTPMATQPNYNVAPGQMMPVIREEAEGLVIDVMKWGLIPSWAKNKNIGYKLINARSETVFEKPAWRSAIRTRRCIVPASGFYEWKRDGTAKKQPYYITAKDSSMFYFAGIWETWHDEEGKELHSYSILTTTPNNEMSELHDRMPVILHPNDVDLWPSVDDEDFIHTVMRPYEDGELELVPVSKEVNVVRNNEGSLILPINSK